MKSVKGFRDEMREKSAFKIPRIGLTLFCLIAIGLFSTFLLFSVSHAKEELELNNKPLHKGLRYEDRECLMCHSAKVFNEKKQRRIKAVSLDKLEHSVHKEIHCVMCHRGARLNAEHDHMTAITLVECGDCHYEGNKMGAPQMDIAKEYYEGIHGKDVLDDPKGHLTPYCWDCHTGHSVQKVDGEKSSVDRDRVVKICTNCHYEESKMKKYNLKSSFIVQYEQTPHSIARRIDKNAESAICTDCHGNHNIKKRDDPQNPLRYENLPKTCGKCHEEIFETYITSIHGSDWLEGNEDVPVCSTCHGEHEIRYIKKEDATVYASNIVSLCSDCHANEALRWKYRIEEDAVTTYKETYHGVVNVFGDAKVANCASCHGYHNILPSEDPRSSVNPENLPKTCGHCHKRAELNKNIGRIHTGAERESSTLLFAIKVIYILMIIGSIGGLLFYISTDLYGYMRRRRSGEREHGAHPSLPDDMEVERWPISYRVQHILLVISFTMLALTGIPLVVPEFFVFKYLLSIEWLYALRGITHRIFAFAMIGLCAYHVLFVIANKSARKDILNMVPKPKDAMDGLNSVLYNLTIRKEHPRMPRYNFIEKFEYLAVVWGSFVMIVTGLILTFNTFLLHYLPKIAFDIATLVHKFEAILATLAILIWHMYTVHLCPDFFPMNKVFLNGRISLRNLRKHHGEEYDEVVEKLREDMDSEKQSGARENSEDTVRKDG